jgi:hypothetical protein
MSKFVFIDDQSRVQYVEDTRPNIASGPLYVEVSNDLVAEHWYFDKETSTVYEYRPYTIDEVRDMRDVKLTECDWMVLEDSPYQAPDQSTNLAAIKTYRQALRDFPDPSVSYNENNINWPTLTLS